MVEEGVGGELEELLVVVVVVDPMPGAGGIRFPPADESPLTGVEGNTLGFVFGVGGPPVENIDGNCCCCWGEPGKDICSRFT